MVQLAVADIIVLVCVSIGTTIFILFPQLPTECRFLHHFFAFMLNLGWHPGCCFLCLIVYSRYITLCGNDKLEVYFSQTKMRIYIISSWLVMGAVYSVQFYNPEGGSLTRWSPDILSWGNDIETGSLGKLLLILTMSQSYISFAFIGFYNLRVLFWLHRVRHSATMVDNSYLCKKELQLFLQGLITGTCFMGVIGTYVVLNIFRPRSYRSIWCYLWLDFTWLINASINPMIYCMLNR
uniref:Vomeronasal type-1 receptor n=1 Tax=Romanomermis culicivorax TaxID=13658 RepID=A0A915JUD4_ROMCU